ncbi:MAG: hypothetical protein IH623_12350 [Verrucomicrobia bacterium]|nr:hypothetical protein [Verrucomicrobiota bacterium]
MTLLKIVVLVATCMTRLADATYPTMTEKPTSPRPDNYRDHDEGYRAEHEHCNPPQPAKDNGWLCGHA